MDPRIVLRQLGEWCATTEQAKADAEKRATRAEQETARWAEAVKREQARADALGAELAESQAQGEALTKENAALRQQIATMQGHPDVVARQKQDAAARVKQKRDELRQAEEQAQRLGAGVE
jgi:chromosome segregation ATPase